jgi:hypothetical protein
VGLAAAAGAGYGYGVAAGGLTGTLGLRLAVVAGLLALVAGLLVDLGGQGLVADGAARARSAIAPAGSVLPLALAAPAVYLAGRVLLG